MRVLWIAGIFHPQTGGIPVYVDRLTQALHETCDVGIVTDARDRAPSAAGIAHLPVANLTRPATPGQWRAAGAGVREAVARFDPDVVHFASAGETVYAATMKPVRATVASVHGNDLTAPWQATPGLDTAGEIRRGLNGCNRLFAVSGHTARFLAEWGVDRPATIVTAGCDLDVFRPLPGTSDETRRRFALPTGRPLLLTVGRLVPRKGHAVVLAALERLALPVHWAVVGTGPERAALEREIAARNLGDVVSLLGSASKRDLALLYNACDVFVLTPTTRSSDGAVDSEGFGLVYLEASACGAPVIAADGAGCREAVIDGCTGLLVPPGDAAALADALSSLLADPARGRELGRVGSAFVHASGGWRRLAQETLDIYRAVAAA